MPNQLVACSIGQVDLCLVEYVQIRPLPKIPANHLSEASRVGPATGGLSDRPNLRSTPSRCDSRDTARIDPESPGAFSAVPFLLPFQAHDEFLILRGTEWKPNAGAHGPHPPDQRLVPGAGGGLLVGLVQALDQLLDPSLDGAQHLQGVRLLLIPRQVAALVDVMHLDTETGSSQTGLGRSRSKKGDREKKWNQTPCGTCSTHTAKKDMDPLIPSSTNSWFPPGFPLALESTSSRQPSWPGPRASCPRAAAQEAARGRCAWWSFSWRRTEGPSVFLGSFSPSWDPTGAERRQRRQLVCSSLTWALGRSRGGYNPFRIQ